jgi:hypothetical protein
MKIHFEFFRQKLGLMLALVGVSMTQNLLQGDNIGVNFLQNFGDPFGRKLAVNADAFVNVVGCNADFVHKYLVLSP